MPDLLAEVQDALAAGMPLAGIADNDIGRWRTGIVPQAMWEDAVVGALMRFCWERKWIVITTSATTYVHGYTFAGTNPLPLLRAVRKAWEDTK